MFVIGTKETVGGLGCGAFGYGGAVVLMVLLSANSNAEATSARDTLLNTAPRDTLLDTLFTWSTSVGALPKRRGASIMIPPPQLAVGGDHQ